MMTQMGHRSAMALRRFNWAGWTLVVGLVLGWQVLVTSGTLTLQYVPAPNQVVDALGDDLASGVLMEGIRHTVVVALVATVLAVAIGVGAGVLLALSGPVWVYSMATIDFLRSLPVMAMMPVALLIWGSSSRTEVIVATFAATWLVLINTLGGVRNIHERLSEVGLTLQLHRRDQLLKVVVPAAMPSILVGVRLAAVAALVVAVVAEMVINPAGLGWALSSAQMSLDPGRLFGYAVVAGVLGYIVNAVIIGAAGRLYPGMKALLSAGEGAR